MNLFLRFFISVATWLGFSMIASAAPVAPTNCVAAGVAYSGGGATFAISWTDASTNETKWIVQVSLNNGASYSTLSSVASASGSSTGSVLTVSWTYQSASLGSTYLFRVWADNGTSSASNVASVTPALFPVTATVVPNQVAVNLSWPEVTNASGYRIWGAQSGGSFSVIANVAAGNAGAQIAAPVISSARTYGFVVQPYLHDKPIADSSVVSVAVNVVTSKTGTSGTPGSAISHTFTQSTVASVVSRSLTYNGQSNLPSGLVFNSSTGALSGVYPALGNHTLLYTANLSNGTNVTQSFSVRVRPAAGPPVAGEIPAWTGVVGESRDSNLAEIFSDAEAESAVRVSTSLGEMDFILFDSATPATVANFRNYVNAGKYTDVAFHRSISDFVIQSGGFAGTGTGSNFNSVVPAPSVVNEPGIANARGTIAMAKVGGDADSATSQFFVSTGDNRSNLDYQNGGFTVFGRVAGDGMTVVDAINDLPTSTYDLNVNGSGSATAFSNFPMNAIAAPASMDQSKVVKIHSVTPIATMAFSVTGNSNPSVASASVVGDQLHLEALSGGQTTITVAATDLDNLTTTQTVEVEISDNYSAWATRGDLPGGQDGMLENPDGDALNNLLEYAFLENPALPNPVPLPIAGRSGDTPETQFLTLTFPLRKFTDGLSYVVEGAAVPNGSWSTIWNSADGLANPQVLDAVNMADRTEVTIRDSVAIGSQSKRFLRVRIVQE